MAFHELTDQNVFSWNLYLKVFVKCFNMQKARQVFDEMPERDVVSWNSMISGYVSGGFFENAWETFLEMQHIGVKPSGFTFSILISCVKCADYGKQMHGNMTRNGFDYSNLVVGNSLIDMYGKLGLVDYAVGVFFTMPKVDVISWNSLISGCCKSGYEKLALSQFCSMRGRGLRPDEYTVSAVLTVCSNLRNLEVGKKILCLCMKMGFLRNTIVSSAAIDLLSKCNRMEDAICLFDESNIFDSALSNSMIACYARHGLEENALEVFVLALRENIRPTEFTLSCVLGSAAVFLPWEQGSQVHALVVKSGFETDDVVASSLVEMYSKYGLIDSALNIFSKMGTRDLISWNTMIIGLAYNGKAVESLCLFEELLESGLHPDHITLAGALLACSYGGLPEEGMAIFSSMEKEYGITPRNEHYACVVDMISRAGNIEDAMLILETMPHKPSALLWESVLRACGDLENLELIERITKRMIDLELQSSLPYLVLAHTYEQRGKWESLVRVRKVMEKMSTKKVASCSWIGLKDHVYAFEANQMIHHGGKDVYLILRLLMEEVQGENNPLQISDIGK
ncbi:Tetratricopeptide repeat (TPR)-like superfamily protein [Forsythia ovata]|uniref:Tetratricopeptide repeat (TPR)-like superfamily protein n=1 Tax=Forsythia ovata TaxID=205694 RepID=A0ABD1U4N4_9LAMI